MSPAQVHDVFSGCMLSSERTWGLTQMLVLPSNLINLTGYLSFGLCGLSVVLFCFSEKALTQPANEPFFFFRPSSSLSDEVTRRDHSIKKCGALVLFSVVMGAIAVMNFSFAFFVAMFQVPVYLFVYPSASR